MPKKGIAYDNEINYAMRAKKDILELNWRDTTPTRLPYFMLHPPGYDEWLENPEYRLSEESKPENAVLLVDDFVSGGQTMYKTQCELIKLWYQKDSIFSYAHTLDFNDKYQLLDAQNKEITLQQLLEILKQ